MASPKSITQRIYKEVGPDFSVDSTFKDTPESSLQDPGQRIVQASAEVARLLGNYGVVPPLGGFPSEHPFDEVMEKLDIKRPTGPADKEFWVLELHYYNRGKTWGTGLQADGTLLTLPEGKSVGPTAELLFTDDYNADSRNFGPKIRAKKWCDRLVTFGASMLKGESHNPWISDHKPSSPQPANPKPVNRQPEDSITNRIYEEIGSDLVYKPMTKANQEIRLHEAQQRMLQASIEVAELLRREGILPPLEGFSTEGQFTRTVSYFPELKRPTGPKGKKFWVLELHCGLGNTTWGTGLQANGRLIALPNGNNVSSNPQILFMDKYNGDLNDNVVPEIRAQRWSDRLVKFGATVMKGEFYTPPLTYHSDIQWPPRPNSPPGTHVYTPPFIPAGTGYDDTRR